MSWCVYKHTSPSGKVYVGITSNLERRWAAKGYYYCLSDTIFSRALRKYGWDSFKHEVLVSNISEAEAKLLEQELIQLYKVMGMSYNMSDGGEGYKGKHTKSHIEHMVQSRLTNSKTFILVINKDFTFKVFRGKTEAAKWLHTTGSVVSHVLKQPLGYTCKQHYLWEQDRDKPIDIEEIQRAIQKAVLQRSKLTSLHKTKSYRYDNQ